jgi:hypothetical protein
VLALVLAVLMALPLAGAIRCTTSQSVRCESLPWDAVTALPRTPVETFLPFGSTTDSFQCSRICAREQGLRCSE